jgi:hypothetical protein
MTMPEEIPLQATPFAEDFVDVAALNAHISTHLIERVQNVKRAARAGESVTSKAIAVLGPAGGGKTHLFSRLSHQSGLRPTLVLLRPYFGVNVSLRDVLAGVIDQLCLPVHGDDRTQLDVIASHWAPRGEVEGGVRAVVSLLPGIAPAAHLARTLLELRGREPSTTWGDLAWLSGREPRASSEGASASALSEGDVLHVLRIVAVLAAPVAPIVLTFDQLENLAGDDDARVLGYGNLVSEIVDCLPCFTVVQLALTSEWMQHIEPRLSLPQKTRLAGDTFVLEAPARRERELLLRAWHQRFVPKTSSRRKGRFPSPLSEEQLSQLLDAPGMTPRILLLALSRAMSGDPMRIELPSSPSSSVGVPGEAGIEALWSAEYERVRTEQADKERSNLAFDAGRARRGVDERARLRAQSHDCPPNRARSRRHVGEGARSRALDGLSDVVAAWFGRCDPGKGYRARARHEGRHRPREAIRLSGHLGNRSRASLELRTLAERAVVVAGARGARALPHLGAPPEQGPREETRRRRLGRTFDLRQGSGGAPRHERAGTMAERRVDHAMALRRSKGDARGRPHATARRGPACPGGPAPVCNRFARPRGSTSR